MTGRHEARRQSSPVRRPEWSGVGDPDWRRKALTCIIADCDKAEKTLQLITDFGGGRVRFSAMSRSGETLKLSGRPWTCALVTYATMPGIYPMQTFDEI